MIIKFFFSLKWLKVFSDAFPNVPIFFPNRFPSVYSKRSFAKKPPISLVSSPNKFVDNSEFFFAPFKPLSGCRQNNKLPECRPVKSHVMISQCCVGHAHYGSIWTTLCNIQPSSVSLLSSPASGTWNYSSASCRWSLLGQSSTFTPCGSPTCNTERFVFKFARRFVSPPTDSTPGRWR